MEGPLVTLAMTYGLVAILPGSNFLIVSQLALRAPRPRACSAACGVASGAAAMGAAAFTGGPLLSPLVEQTWMFDLVFAGLMIRLGMKAIWRGAHVQHQAVSSASASKCFRIGFVSAASNPTTLALMVSIAAGPLFAPDACQPGACAATIFLIATIWFGAVAFIFSDIRFKAIYVRLQPWIDPVIGLLLIALALRTLLRLVPSA